MFKLLKKETGFTLIELTVVIAILGILATLAIPHIADLSGEATEAVVENNLKNFHTSIITWKMENGSFPDDLSEFPEDVYTDAGKGQGNFYEYATCEDENNHYYISYTKADGTTTAYFVDGEKSADEPNNGDGCETWVSAP